MPISATLTCTTYTQSIKLNNNGAPTFVYGHLDTAAHTLSDIILLCRLPSGCTVIDYYLRGSTGETAAVVRMGATGGGSATTFFTSVTLSTNSATLGRRAYDSLSTYTPTRFSISDTDAQAGVDVYMTCQAGTFTTSFSFDFGFWYVRDGVVT